MLRKRHDESQSFTRRAFLLACGKGFLATALVGRMFYLQVYRSEHYRTLSYGNRIRLDLIPPNRGLIKDCQQALLAENKKNFRVILIGESPEHIAATLRHLGHLITLESQIVEHVLSDIETPLGMPVTIKENLTWDEVSLIELNKPDLEGVFIQQGYTRFYPLVEKAAHVIGYVQSASKQEANENKLLRLPGFKLGKTGIEKIYESSLQGQPGYREIEVNALRQEVREVQEKSSIPGSNISLTLDRRLQEDVYDLLSQEKSGAAVVLDVKKGDVLALASFPSYDPNLFPGGIGSKDWQALRDNLQNPLLNKVIAGAYPPGSIFKIIIALAALEKDVDTEERIYCSGVYRMGTHDFHCHSHKKGGHGPVNLKEAIMVSCDAYFYVLALRLGIETIARYARLCGLGIPTGIELPGEKAGLVPDKRWKIRRHKRSWTPADTVLSGIGQGYFLATPLQLATAIAWCVGGGKMVAPHLTPGVSTKQGNVKHLPVKESSLEFLNEAMTAVVNTPGGTGYSVRIEDPDFLMGGKSGTSQVRRIHHHERAAGILTSQQWHEREHALFVGYAPVNRPQFVAAVLVEHGAKGSAVAGPLARDILLKARKYRETI